MQINPINYKYSQISPKKNTPKFKGNVGSNFIRNLDGNKCACCGHEMIQPKVFNDILTKISEPLKDAMNNNKMQVIKNNYPYIWSLLECMSQMYPKASFCKIFSDEDNYAILMRELTKTFRFNQDFKMLGYTKKREKIRTFAEDMKTLSNEHLLNSATVMENLSPLEKYLYGYKKEIFQEFSYLASKYPDKRLGEIIRDRSISEGYIRGTLDDVMDFAGERDEQIKRADNIILREAPDVAEDLKAIHTEIYDNYRHMSDPQKFIYRAKNYYTDLLRKIGLEKLQDAVVAEIEALPLNLFTKNSFLSHARRYYSDMEIVNYMIMPFMETEEHIIPQVKDGTNAINNKLVFCRECNIRRKATPYAIFLQYHPEMIENTKWQIDFIGKKILDGTISMEAREYPIKVAHNLSLYTEGILSPDVYEYAKAILEISEKESQKTRTELSEVCSKRYASSFDFNRLKETEVNLRTKIRNDFDFIESVKRVIDGHNK